MLRILSVLILFISMPVLAFSSKPFIKTFESRQFQISIYPVYPLERYVMSNAVREGQLWFLLYKLQNENFSDSDYVQVNIHRYESYKSDKIIFDHRPYCLGYEHCTFNVVDKENFSTGKQIVREAVVLNVLTDNLSEGDCLNLILYALKHKTEIKANQHIALALRFNAYDQYLTVWRQAGNNPLRETEDFRFIHTIAQKEIDNILLQNNLFVKQLLVYKFYQCWYPLYSAVDKISFYCQHDSIYICDRGDVKTQKIQKVNYSTNKWVLADTLNTALAKFHNVSNISCDRKGNYLIFDHNQFYHYQFTKKVLKGPFSFPELENNLGENRYILDSCYMIEANLFIIVRAELGFYNTLYNTRTGHVYVDTNSYSVGLKKGIDEERRTEKNKKRRREQSTIEDLLY